MLWFGGLLWCLRHRVGSSLCAAKSMVVAPFRKLVGRKAMPPNLELSSLIQSSRFRWLHQVSHVVCCLGSHSGENDPQGPNADRVKEMCEYLMVGFTNFAPSHRRSFARQLVSLCEAAHKRRTPFSSLFWLVALEPLSICCIVSNTHNN